MKTEWQEWGNETTGTGYIAVVEIPWPLWILDQLMQRHPHWGWWYAMWTRLLPGWGDPLCAAYCFPWSNFYWRHNHEVHKVEVGVENLSPAWHAASTWPDDEPD